MGATLGELKIKLNYAVGTAETNLLTTDKREHALNQAIKRILEMYAIPQYTISTDLSLVLGVVALPTDCLMPYLLHDSSDNDYDLIDFDKFRRNITYSYIIKWDTTSSVEKINTYPASTQTLTFWYIQHPTALSDDADTIRFNSYWDDAIAEKAAEILFTSSRNFSAATAKREAADDLIAKAWQMERGRLTGSQDQRLQSVYESRSLLGGYSNNTNS